MFQFICIKFIQFVAKTQAPLLGQLISSCFITILYDVTGITFDRNRYSHFILRHFDFCWHLQHFIWVLTIYFSSWWIIRKYCVCRFGYKIEKMPPSYFNISVEQARSLACSATYSWNNGIGILRSLCKGKDWSLMFKVCNYVLFAYYISS